MNKPRVLIKRCYQEASKADGVRILVDRLWPRGLSKDKAEIVEWAKELAPSTELRKWFDHQVERWPEFKRKYEQELKGNGAINDFVATYRQRPLITLVYSAKDEQHNQAVVLQSFLVAQF
ncbi:MAG: DUF488 family protein [Bacteroidetes bacterium]|nr:DUF488 family protein [Bacteroidota bacterium]